MSFNCSAGFRAWLVVMLCTLAPSAIFAQQVVIVERNVNLRRDPSTNQTPIKLFLPPEELELLDSAKTNNYYNVVHAESGDTGWVWANNVRVEDLGTPGSAVLTTAVANQIDPAWPKPTPTVGTFQSPVRPETCGPNGKSGSDTGTNRLKNRTDIPASYNAVTFDAIGDLPYPATRDKKRLTWPAESLAIITQFEGAAVQVVGYLVAIKPQGAEATNCDLGRASESDRHVALVESEGEGEKEAIVVETTPRIRINRPKWTVGRLNDWLDSPNPVRISGWLMFDPSHRNHLGTFRKTLWEIHPITRIEVWHEAAWVNLDNIP